MNDSPNKQQDSLRLELYEVKEQVILTVKHRSISGNSKKRTTNLHWFVKVHPDWTVVYLSLHGAHSDFTFTVERMLVNRMNICLIQLSQWFASHTSLSVSASFYLRCFPDRLHKFLMYPLKVFFFLFVIFHSLHSLHTVLIKTRGFF